MFGASRWLNALGVMATEDNAARISMLPFVERIQEIESGGMVVASIQQEEAIETDNRDKNPVLTDQLVRFGGQYFIDKGID